MIYLNKKTLVLTAIITSSAFCSENIRIDSSENTTRQQTINRQILEMKRQHFRKSTRAKTKLRTIRLNNLYRSKQNNATLADQFNLNKIKSSLCSGNYQAAKPLFHQLSKEVLKSDKFSLLRGFYREMTGDCQRAHEYYRLTYRRSKSEIKHDAAFNLASSYFEHGDMMRAMAWYQHAARVMEGIEKYEGDAHFMLGVVSEILKHKNNAIISYHKARSTHAGAKLRYSALVDTNTISIRQERPKKWVTRINGKPQTYRLLFGQFATAIDKKKSGNNQ